MNWFEKLGRLLGLGPHSKQEQMFDAINQHAGNTWWQRLRRRFFK